MKRAAVLLLSCWLLLAGTRPATGTDKPLIFGVFPHMSARQTVESYRPLADALEQQLHRRVLVYSARDFLTFVERSRHGEYDILLTAPHLAWLARQDVGYRPLVKYAEPVRGLLVVKTDSPIRDIESLRGRAIATTDPLALAALALEAELAAHGLQHDIDYRTSVSVNHTNAAMQVVSGRADAAMLGLHPYNLLAPGLRRQLRVLAETPPLSGLVYLTHPRIRDAEAQAVREALLGFARSPEGQAFMQRGGYRGFAEVDGSELRAFRPYAIQTQKILHKTR